MARSGWTTLGTLDTSNVTDVPSHWHVKRTRSADKGIYKPSMPFTMSLTVTAKELTMARYISDDAEAAIQSLCTLYLRPCSLEGDPVNGVRFVFVPPLTGAEQTVFDRISRLARSAVPGITPAEWEALEPDIAGLTTYQGLPSPTLAQTVLAVKAQSRILRALLRD